MSSMHWEKRNRERKIGIPLAERHMRLPGWKDRPPPLSFKRWPSHVPTHDNASPAVRQQRKARITLPQVSILKSD